MKGPLVMSEALETLPDSMRCSLQIGTGDFTIKDLRDYLARPEVISTADAHRRWPRYSESTWRKWAREGKLEGAWRDEAGGPWSLPVAGCQAWLDERRESAHE